MCHLYISREEIAFLNSGYVGMYHFLLEMRQNRITVVVAVQIGHLGYGQVFPKINIF